MVSDSEVSDLQRVRSGRDGPVTYHHLAYLKLHAKNK